MWDGIAQMRKEITAPVDTMGGSTVADKSATPNEQAY